MKWLAELIDHMDAVLRSKSYIFIWHTTQETEEFVREFLEYHVVEIKL